MNTLSIQRSAPPPKTQSARASTGRWRPGAGARGLRMILVAGLHLALAAAGWQVVLRPEHPPTEAMRVLIVDQPRAPEPEAALPRRPALQWQAQPILPPEVVVQRPPDVEPHVVAVPLPKPEPEPVTPLRPPPTELPRVAAALPPPTPPPAPAAPRQLPAGAVAYLVPPPIELPLASRRLGEQGTVWLRVRVGADGLPRQVTLHKSSGHPRLDEQALGAMRQARFKPQVENGVPVEWIVIAPLQYEIS